MRKGDVALPARDRRHDERVDRRLYRRRVRDGQPEGYDETVNVDASTRYKITQTVELSLEDADLTEKYRSRCTDLPANRHDEHNQFGRTLPMGAVQDVRDMR